MADSLIANRATSAANAVVVTDVPKIDLESYIQNYRGRTRTERLLLIAYSSTVLGLDALKLAARDAIDGRDVELYRQVVEHIRTVDPTDPAATYDRKWAETTEKINKAELDRLETELKGYKNNLVKESIRMGNEDLAKYYESIGELNQAYDIYSKMRADASSTKHILEVGLHLARVSVLRHDWAMVISNTNKMSGLQGADNDDKSQQSQTKQIALSNIQYGIGLLGQGNYLQAAQSFTRVDPSIEASQYDELASPNDVATYGGLLALATMDREALSKFLDSSPFRSFLELEPHFRRAISQFVNGRYSACLAILESYRTDYLLDIYLQPHVNKLYKMVRTKCIFNFLQPFSCVTIDSMNATFASPGESIEVELVDMIRNGGLQARIDAIDRVITTVRIKPRTQMQAEALASVKQIEQDAIDRVRRIAIISADLEVKGNKQQKAGRGGRQGGPGEGNPRVGGGYASFDGPGDDLPDFQASGFVASQY